DRRKADFPHVASPSPLRAGGVEGEPGRSALLDHHHDAGPVRTLDSEAPMMREPLFNLLPRPEPVALTGRRVLVLGLGDPVLSVTGTNGKSTVTALTGHLLRKAGLDCEVAGNIGPAVLDASLRRTGPPAAWVLELSSYQLETTWSLDPEAAAMLNLTEDHLDRYAGLAAYGAANARIFIGSGIQVLNRG